MVNSGTVALYLSLILTKIKGGVIIPTLTCKSVLDAVLTAGLTPIFADVEPDTHNIDLSSLTDDQWAEAKCVIVVHSYGHSVDIDKLYYYIKKYKLVLIEDFAQSTGGLYKNRMVGSFGDISVTSFYGPKIMTTGHGGAILTDDIEIYNKCKCMISCKSEKMFSPGTLNFQMTDIEAAIGLEQLKKLSKIIELRRIAAKAYYERLKNINIGLPTEKGYATHAFYKYHIILPNNVNKIDFINKMMLQRIQTGVLYTSPLHKMFSISDQNYYKNLKLRVAESIVPHIISLPMYPELSIDDINTISNAVRNILKE